MKTKDRNAAKELYREMRDYSWPRLWEEEVPRFDAASSKEREKLVGIIRAVGVVFAESGAIEEKPKVQHWLSQLLQDPSEKVRRYAMAALPKIGADSKEEATLLSALQTTTIDRERQFLRQTIAKIGGQAALEHGSLGDAEQKVKASMARRENPSAVRTDAVLENVAEARIHLRGREGMERFISDEVTQKFRVAESRSGCVTLVPLGEFSLADIYKLRCFDTMGFVLGNATEDLAAVITSPLSRRLFEAFTAGALRYRLNFVGKGHQRAAVEQLANRVYALCPEMINDGRSVTWTIDIHPNSVELRPNMTPDPRFSYRQKDVPAASHPPLAAALARLAGTVEHEVIWDPFCGSGLELIESARLSAAPTVYGTDKSPDAVRIAQSNFASAKVKAVSANFICGDFREIAEKHFKPGAITLMITNPPMGRRAPVGDLRSLMEELFRIAGTLLKPGGRLVLVNPLSIKAPPSLRLQFQQKVDLGGFECRVEKYVHV